MHKNIYQTSTKELSCLLFGRGDRHKRIGQSNRCRRMLGDGGSGRRGGGRLPGEETGDDGGGVWKQVEILGFNKYHTFKRGRTLE